ncbi:MAG: outer membrane lipoprotein-sorting protein [Myxococcota bacterium]
MSSARAASVLPVFLAAAVAVGIAPAVRAQSGSIAEVADCAIRNLPPSAHGHAKLVSRAADGVGKTIEVDYWSHTPDLGARQIVIALRGAPDGEVAAYLFSDGDAIGEAWAYTKGAAKAQRITTTGVEVRFFGTSLSLEDFARFARVVFPGRLRRLADAEIGARKVYVIETQPAPDAGSAYARIVTSIDREWCLILRRESFDAGFEGGARARKIYRVDPADVRVDGKFANAKRARQEDAEYSASTEMEVLELELPAKVDDAFFTPDALPRASH